MHRTLYHALTAATLAGTLAACSTDQAGQTAALPTPPAVAPATPAAPAGTASVAAGPQATTKPTAEAPASRLATSKAPRNAAAKPVAKPKRWVSQAPVPSLAEGPPELSLSCGGLETDAERAIKEAKRAAAAIDLPTFCTQSAPGVQVYQVRAGRDTVLLGQQGTRLVIPGRAFEVPANSGPVRLELREFYTTADIILAGLGTRSGQSMLETGGMLHLYAAANGETVHLRPGMQILVQLPTQQQLPGMRFYEGVSADANHAPDWQLPGTGSSGVLVNSPATSRAALQEWAKLHPPKKPHWPAFAKGNETLLKEFDRLMPASKADQAWLRRKRTIAKGEQQMLKELSRENHTAIRHAILLDVAVDSTGALQKSELVLGDSVLGAKVLAAVRQLPMQQPASYISRLPRRGRTTSAAQGVFSVLYARSGKQLVGFQWLLMDKQFQEELAIEAQRSRAVFAKQFNSATTPLTLSSGLYYELTAGGLGWINCDRLLEPGPRTQFAVQAPDANTVVSLVFKGQRSILPSSRFEGSAAVFEQVPTGAAATVVALRRESGVTYLATSGVSLGQATPPALSFHPVSLEQLRSELAAL